MIFVSLSPPQHHLNRDIGLSGSPNFDKNKYFVSCILNCIYFFFPLDLLGYVCLWYRYFVDLLLDISKKNLHVWLELELLGCNELRVNLFLEVPREAEIRRIVRKFYTQLIWSFVLLLNFRNAYLPSLGDIKVLS